MDKKIKEKSIEDEFQKLSPNEAVLKRPGMYIGDITTDIKKLFIVDNINADDYSIIEKDINYNPGFCKLFDEILTNASDASIRTGQVKYIKVFVESDHIIIENDGPGIPIEMHKVHKMYVPELIFGHLHSGSNFNDDEKRTWGGTNGIGAKAVNIYSKKFIIETADGKNKYIQIFENNLSKTNKPKISKSKKNYTKITYYPDFERFGLKEITEEIQQFFIKRTIDISVYCPKVKVYYNDKLIKMKSFKDYIKMHLSNESEIYYEKINENWEIGITSSEDSFRQVSLVNCINTYIGGTHVNFITNQIIKGIKEDLEKKHKKITIKQSDIKNKLFVFINCRLPNPIFDTQTKENLTLKLTSEITNGVNISDKLIKQLSQSVIVEDIIRYILIKEQSELTKLGRGKVNRVKIKKLDDANFAGTNQSDRCILFLAEGDSAAGSVLTGFASTGRDYYGCLAMRGKLLNVKKASLAKIKEDEGVKNIINALGLEIGKKYSSTKELRYGKVVLSCDQDVDGYHIKGLLINLLETFWPELLEFDFIYDFVTPIVKIEKGKNIKYFYKLEDYKKWRDLNETGWFLTYYKGLGTLEAFEIKDIFKKILKHIVKFNYTEFEETKNCISLAFDEKRTDNRKEWLLNYKGTVEIDKFVNKTTYKSFFDDEYIQYSMSDNIRSIPSVIDGFKPSQRKILYTMFKNNYKEKIKVSNLSGAVIERSSYHHGNSSIEGAVVNMAQNFINTNNINLLEPLGNYGSRLKGGLDAASSRYIFTKLSPITRSIFLEEDDHILEYLHDDGTPIEPKFYMPIIPMSLVNGSEGIGTGWSTFIPKFDPKDIIKYLASKLQGKNKVKINPYYKGFKGEIIFDKENNRYISRGIITKMNMSNLKISELPIGMWNDNYYDVLDKLIEKGVIKDYVKNDTDTKVDITVNISREKLKELEENNENLLRLFNLETYLTMNNLMLWDYTGKIKKYNSPEEIVEEFYEVRLDYYEKRKNYLISRLEYEKKVIFNRMKFINAILKNSLKINNRKKEEIENDLITLNLEKIEDSFAYLLNMSIVSLTTEKLHDLKESFDKKKDEIKAITETTVQQLWLEDLKNLMKYLK